MASKPHATFALTFFITVTPFVTDIIMPPRALTTTVFEPVSLVALAGAVHLTVPAKETRPIYIYFIFLFFYI